MFMKKLAAAALASCMTFSVLAGSAAFAADDTEPAESAASSSLKFDIRSQQSNSVSLTTADLAENDVTVPVQVFIPENPGVNGISLKFQINDGEVDESGAFGNYGFSLASGGYASPYCFDSANSGDSSKALTAIFTPSAMNMSWIYSADQTVNADATAEAGTVAWNADAEWGMDYPFLEMELVVPQGLAAGEYRFDIRTEPYVNILSTGQATQKKNRSLCTTAASTEAVAFTSVPLVITVSEPETTTSATTTSTTVTTITTTSEASTDTAPGTDSCEISTDTLPSTESVKDTETTTSEISTSTEPQPTGEPWKDDYAGMSDDFYLVIGDVCGAPGERVMVPVYIYNAPGLAGCQLYFTYSRDLTVNRISADKTNPAYVVSAKSQTGVIPSSYVFSSSDGMNMTAESGAIVCDLYVNIPEDAENGKVYEISFYTEEDAAGNTDAFTQICDEKRNFYTPPLFSGSVTVVTDSKTPSLNYNVYSLSGPDQHVNLTLFNAYGDVTWSSSDEAVATVDQNGFVTSTGLGSCQIIAANNGKEYTCSLRVGLLGDINGDGIVDTSDAILALVEFTYESIGADPLLTPDQILVGDVDYDGALTTDDATFILKYYTLYTVMDMTDATWYDVTKNPLSPGAPAE